METAILMPPETMRREFHSEKRVLVLSYSQSGDAARCAAELLEPLRRSGVRLTEVEICPLRPYPFPWGTLRKFFNVMPDCILGKTPEIEFPEIDEDVEWDLVILVYQVWFLAPSLPIQAFLRHPAAKCLRGCPVVTLSVCRNMWLAAAERMSDSLRRLGAHHVDNVVVTHQGPIWATFITTPRYLLWGRRDRLWNLFPEPGVGTAELSRVASFGRSLAAQSSEFEPDRRAPFLSGQGATRIEEKYILPELIGRRMFRLFAHLIERFESLGGRFLRGVGVYLFVATLVAGVVVGIPVLFGFRLLFSRLLRPFLSRYKEQMSAPSDSFRASEEDPVHRLADH